MKYSIPVARLVLIKLPASDVPMGRCLLRLRPWMVVLTLFTWVRR
jgi:hypothetical protein